MTDQQPEAAKVTPEDQRQALAQLGPSLSPEERRVLEAGAAAEPNPTEGEE